MTPKIFSGGICCKFQWQTQSIPIVLEHIPKVNSLFSAVDDKYKRPELKCSNALEGEFKAPPKHDPHKMQD